MNEIGKIPPQAIDIEESIIGCILIDKNAIDRISNVKAEYFYKENHQKIYECILSLNKRSQPIDDLTLTEELKKTKYLDQIGGPYYISQLSSKANFSSNIEHYAKILIEKYARRELIRISSDTINQSFDEVEDIVETLGFVNKSIDNITNNVFDIEENKSISEIVKKSIYNYSIRDAKYQKGEVDGIPTCLNKLTKITNGWQNGDLIILAARSSMG